MYEKNVEELSNNKGDENVAKTMDREFYEILADKNVSKALSEVEKIRAGLLPRKTARDFLKESREQN